MGLGLGLGLELGLGPALSSGLDPGLGLGLVSLDAFGTCPALGRPLRHCAALACLYAGSEHDSRPARPDWPDCYGWPESEAAGVRGLRQDLWRWKRRALGGIRRATAGQRLRICAFAIATVL